MLHFAKTCLLHLLSFQAFNKTYDRTMLDWLTVAFDTLDHNIMLSRFQNQFGITGTALQWFQSYFTQRKNHVHINGANSDIVPLICGVPQGSVIGPQSFPMYV